ncbi:MAG: glutathione S-transferase family protein [Granulosicoccaceae bacterium]
MIKLHGFGANNGLPDASPFVLKVDAYLRLAGIPFESVSSLDNMQKAPKGKLPFISDGEQIIADSRFIIEHLESYHGVDLDSHLSEEQKAIAYMVQSTLEEKLYWCALYFRWIDEPGWQQVKQAFFGRLSMPLKLILPWVVRRSMRGALKGHGIGRHSPEEIQQIAREIFAHVDALLGEGPYLFGAKPCSADASLYGFLAQSTLATIHTPINQIAAEFPKLQAYCEGFQATHYPG